MQLSWCLYLWKSKYNWAGVCICENRTTTELVSSVFVKIEIQLRWWLYLWKSKYNWAGVICIWRFSWSSCSLPPKKLPSSTPSWKNEQMTKKKDFAIRALNLEICNNWFNLSLLRKDKILMKRYARSYMIGCFLRAFWANIYHIISYKASCTSYIYN